MTRQIECEGFQDMGESELSEVLNADDNLTVEEIEEILRPELPVDEPQVSEEPTLTSRAVSEIIKSIRDGIDKAIECDPIMTRRLKLKEECESAIRAYEEIQRDFRRRARQTQLTQFFQPNTHS
ncbi:hypothetical protein QAD02_010344 [Eretmocerus hayati]|uniref:Uncharacterized protein n=1 Tax=Eretmocerus hayati TaxID=131215 RepID=A0ACC2NDF2_9HYME|nr:hypothetical protein QAD02_010344 [Eretmocerus hayati]